MTGRSCDESVNPPRDLGIAATGSGEPVFRGKPPCAYSAVGEPLAVRLMRLGAATGPGPELFAPWVDIASNAGPDEDRR